MKLGLILAATLLMSMPSFAGITACPTTYPSPLSGLPFSTPPASLTNGCTVTNLQFSNFFVGTVVSSSEIINGITLEANTAGLTPPSSSDISGSSPSGTVFRLAPIPPNSSGVGCGTNGPGGVFGWCLQNDNTGAQTITSSVTYLVTATSGLVSSYSLSITAAEHTVGGAGTGLPAQATGFREICTDPGTLFPTDATGTTACSPGNYYVMQIGTLSFAGHSNVYNSANLSVSFAGVNTITIRDTIFLKTQNGGGAWAAIGAADLLTPEPSTFVLFGSALVGLGFARFRRRKKA